MELRRANEETAGPAVVFLPGIVAPAEIRYAALVRELAGGIQAFTKDLEIYNSATPPDDYSIDIEVAGLIAAADAVGIDRFFLYGHSAGGAIGLAFVGRHPERLLGLALDEPGSDYSDEAKATWAQLLDTLRALPAGERLQAFLAAQVAPGVTLPVPPSGSAPEWMAKRPAGFEAFMEAMDSYVDSDPSPFDGPVYYSHGSLSQPIWRGICDRLASRFSNFTSEEYEGLHHMNTSHAADPARVAASLRKVWKL
jgi:pimeloyl-ACP methyl ester carboxylesterase